MITNFHPKKNHISMNESFGCIQNFSTNPHTYYSTDFNIIRLEKKHSHSLHSFLNSETKISKKNNYEKIQNNNISKTLYNKSLSQNSNMFKTVRTENKFFLSYKKFLKSINNKISKHKKKPKKITLKILNDFFKPEKEKVLINKQEEKIIKSKVLIKKNYNNEYKKINSTNNNLNYYFPKLFNVPNNKILSPDKNLDKSNFLFKNLKELNYEKEIRNLNLIKNNRLFMSEIKNNHIKNRNDPIFIERVFTYDILKNLRFKFKSPIEKGKFQKYINSFNTTINLKFNN